MFFVNSLEYSVISVEENYITQIVNLSRVNDEGQFNISSVTNFDITKGEVKTRDVDTWWGGTKQESYRELTVTETTETYKDNKATGEKTSKTYTSEEVVK